MTATLAPDLAGGREAALRTALREMVDIYQEEQSGGVPLPLDQQPECIRRAVAALAATE
jgi:hypothetical protein